jgi:hypothetical protein
MSARRRIVCLIAATLLSACTGRAEEAKRVQRVYSVADLVIPFGEPTGGKVAPGRTTAWAVSRENRPAVVVGAAVTTSRPTGTCEDLLIQTITRSIAPQSWGERGGAGSIDFFPLTMSLVVNQTPDVQEQIADLLAALRRLQDMEVTVEVRFAEVPTEVLQELQGKGILADPGKETQGRGGVTFLNDAGVRRFLETIQADPHSSVMQAPRLTAFNGQKAVINVADEQTFVTGLEIVSHEGRVTYQPKTEVIPLGVRIALQPTIAADRRSVRLHLDLNMNQLASGEVPLFPITTPIEPIGEGAPKAKPETFTQYIQQPRVNRLNLDRTLAIPDGKTAVLTGLVKRCDAGKYEYGPPILSDIPCIGRLFRNVGTQYEMHHLLVLATPRICVRPEVEEKRSESPACGKTTICPCRHVDVHTPPHPPVRAEEAVQGEGPSEVSILRALPRTVRVPGLCEVSRDDIQIVTERIVDKIDPPRFFPLVGKARLHHLHWKCSVYYRETITGTYPFPFRSVRPRCDVVYIDTDRLELPDPGERPSK